MVVGFGTPVAPSGCGVWDPYRSRLSCLQNQEFIFHSPFQMYICTGVASGPFRENFARVCFEALLQFSFIHSQDSVGQ